MSRGGTIASAVNGYWNKHHFASQCGTLRLRSQYPLPQFQRAEAPPGPGTARGGAPLHSTPSLALSFFLFAPPLETQEDEKVCSSRNSFLSFEGIQMSVGARKSTKCRFQLGDKVYLRGLTLYKRRRSSLRKIRRPPECWPPLTTWGK